MSAFTKVISAFSIEQQTVIKEIAFRSILDLRCSRQQYDTKRLHIVLHDKEFCLNITNFSIIMKIKEGGELVEIGKKIGDITELCANYRANQRGIEVVTGNDRLIANESSIDDFKIHFFVFLLGTVLCPTSGLFVKKKGKYSS